MYQITKYSKLTPKNMEKFLHRNLKALELRMRRLRKAKAKAVFITLTSLSVGIMPLPVSANNSITSLSVAGFSVSWPQIMYMPTGCSRFEFKYINNAPYAFLDVGFILTDPYGDSVAYDSLIGAPPGRSGIWDEQICAHNLKSGLGPYKIKAYIQDYSNRGGGTLEQYGDVYFTARPGSTGTTTNTPVPKPAAKVMLCKKGSTLKTIVSQNPKCPKGYKKVA